MISPYQPHQRDEIMALWLESTLSGHPFIAEHHWHESYSIVRDIYIPHSKTWVCLQNEKPLGFVSVINEVFIGALFVTPSHADRGVGSQLLSHVQARYPVFILEVYQKNQRAVNFYQRMGFRIEEAAWQHDTQHPTWIMTWKKETS